MDVHGEGRTDGRGERIWVKVADCADDRRSLDREAHFLDRIRHPGVVALAAPPTPDELPLRLVAGGDASGRRLPAVELAGLGAAVATTLADLHDLGAAHGSCTADHILLDPAGRPVLCSFGRAALAGDHHDLAPAQQADVAALSCSLLNLLTEEARPLRRMLERASARTPPARAFARSLATALPGARLPAADDASSEAPGDVAADDTAARRDGGSGRSWVRHVRPIRLAASASAAAAIGLGAVVAAGGGHGGAAGAVVAPGGGHGGAAGARPLPCPAVDDGCGPIADPGGTFSSPTGTWTIGEPGDVVVIGRWGCATALPAVLRVASGQVWVFDRWAAIGADVAGRRVAAVPGARSLEVLPGPGGCDSLEVLTGGSRHVVVRPEVPR